MPRLSLLLLLLCLSTQLVANTTVVFKQTLRDDGTVEQATWTSVERDNTTYINGDNMFDEIKIKAKNNDAFFWHTKSKDGKTDITVTKDSASISMEGTLNGKAISKTIKNKGNSPWLPAPGLMLEGFAKSDKPKAQFYIFSSADKKLVKMVAKKAGTTSLTIEDKTYDALHVEMTPPGIKSMFWKADLYYDSITGTFLKYGGLLGPPGSPYITMELLETLVK